MRTSMAAVVALFLAISPSLAQHLGGDNCRQIDVDFIVLDGDATLLALEDDVRSELAKVGVNVSTRLLAKDPFNAEMVAGNFNLAFSETWGPPYDPHSYAASWNTPDEAYYAALRGLPEPYTQSALSTMIDEVLTRETELAREEGWRKILGVLHSQATELPFSGKRIPAVINNRLSGYQRGAQQFDYPMHTLRVDSGSRNITVSPGGQTGLFAGIGRLDPHSYRPNEFFANNWVYEGLVDYGSEGAIIPSLATSWTVADISGGGQRYTFNLRQGVTFHDGAPWNCSVAKLNFDNVLAPPLTTADWHGWYNLPKQINSWNCSSTYVFEITTRDKYYPLLQELTYIRPLRMLSPTMFVGQYANDPLTQNSCPTGWGSATNDGITVTCAGILGISGTGRWEYITSITDANGDVSEVIFKRNENHWDTTTTGAVVEFMRLIRYQNSSSVKAALLSTELDMVIGEGVLAPADVEEFRINRTASFHVILTESFQNRIIIFNTAKSPTNELQVRKTMIHAVNKAAIIDSELAGLADPVDQLFPRNAPYCNIDLTPRWDYDSEKANLLNCPQPSDAKDDEKEVLSRGAIAAIVILGVVVLLSIIFVLFMVHREKNGEPIFKPLVQKEVKEDVGNGSVVNANMSIAGGSVANMIAKGGNESNAL